MRRHWLFKIENNTLKGLIVEDEKEKEYYTKAGYCANSNLAW